MSTYDILGNSYEILDTKEYITLADSFVLNKTGTGHGEAKLYVGNESNELFSFFENFSNSLNCFFITEDLKDFLLAVKDEFKNPQQEYIDKKNMPNIYDKLLDEITSLRDDILKFNIYRVDVEPPRVYVNSKEHNYKFMRKLGIPNISYLSILKLKSTTGNIVFYFKIFIDYKTDIVQKHLMDRQQRKTIKNTNMNTSKTTRKVLVDARIGQGKYREKLLEDCSYCPFTMVNDERLLIASHIKPWAVSTDKERIDYKNGFMFTPTYDRLFDQGFISFKDDKTLMVSPWISPMNQKRLSIYDGKRIPKLQLDSKRCKYLEYHRNNVFKK